MEAKKTISAKGAKGRAVMALLAWATAFCVVAGTPQQQALALTDGEPTGETALVEQVALGTAASPTGDEGEGTASEPTTTEAVAAELTIAEGDADGTEGTGDADEQTFTLSGTASVGAYSNVMTGTEVMFTLCYADGATDPDGSNVGTPWNDYGKYGNASGQIVTTDGAFKWTVPGDTWFKVMASIKNEDGKYTDNHAWSEWFHITGSGNDGVEVRIIKTQSSDEEKGCSEVHCAFFEKDVPSEASVNNTITVYSNGFEMEYPTWINTNTADPDKLIREIQARNMQGNVTDTITDKGTFSWGDLEFGAVRDANGKVIHNMLLSKKFRWTTDSLNLKNDCGDVIGLMLSVKTDTWTAPDGFEYPLAYNGLSLETHLDQGAGQYDVIAQNASDDPAPWTVDPALEPVVITYVEPPLDYGKVIADKDSYLPGDTMKLEAVAADGYEFDHWTIEGDFEDLKELADSETMQTAAASGLTTQEATSATSSSRIISLKVNGDIKVTPTFKLATAETPDPDDEGGEEGEDPASGTETNDPASEAASDNEGTETADTAKTDAKDNTAQPQNTGTSTTNANSTSETEAQSATEPSAANDGSSAKDAGEKAKDGATREKAALPQTGDRQTAPLALATLVLGAFATLLARRRLRE